MLEAAGVGRTTLREALRLLETRGVIRIRPGATGGTFVRRPKPEDFGDALRLILQFEGGSLSDVFDARISLEPLLAHLAAGRITSEQIARLKACNQAIGNHASDIEIFEEENSAFHLIIANASGSVVLRVFMETLRSIADGRILGVRYPPHRLMAIVVAHNRLIDAFERRDASAAEEEMRAHITEAGVYWERKYPEFYRRPVRWV
jgi:DNA-binding FadR family transcriptional regulator